MNNMGMMNWIDYSIICVMSISVLVGIVRGFVREAMSLVTWITAIFVGIVYCETVANWFSAISVLGIRLLLSFILLVLCMLILGGIISHLIGQLMQSTKFSFTDRIIGTFFGFARGAGIVAAISLIINSTFIAQEPFWQASTLIPHFTPLSTWIKGILPSDLINKLYPNKQQGQEPIQLMVPEQIKNEFQNAVPITIPEIMETPTNETPTVPIQETSPASSSIEPQLPKI